MLCLDRFYIKTQVARHSYGFVLAYLLLAVCTGCATEEGLPQADRHARAVSSLMTVNVVMAEFTEQRPETVVCFGKFKPIREAALSFSRSGVVGEIYKRTGDRVVEGELLATLAQPGIVEQKSAIEAALTQLKDDADQRSAGQSPESDAKASQLRTRLDAVNLELKNGELRALFSGIVAVRSVDAGSPVFAGATAFVIAEDKSPLVQVDVGADTAARVSKDQNLWVANDGIAFVTKIRQRSPLFGPVSGEQLLLEFAPPLTSRQWSYGKVVEIRFRVPGSGSGYWLPTSALHRSADGLWSVFCVEPAQDFAELPPDEKSSVFKVVRRECTLLRQEESRVLLHLADLDVTEPDRPLVIVDGSHRIVPGQFVKLMTVSDSDAVDSPPAGEQRSASEGDQ